MCVIMVCAIIVCLDYRSLVFARYFDKNFSILYCGNFVCTSIRNSQIIHI